MSYEDALKLEKWTSREFCQNCTEKDHCKLEISECPLWEEYKAIKSQKTELRYYKHKWIPKDLKQDDNLIAELWNQGMTSREIAEKLNIKNPNSMKNRIELLKRKGKAKRKYR